MTSRDALREAEERLANAGVESPRVDAEFLLAHVLGGTRSELHADSRRELTEDEAARLDGLLGRRVAREPLAYVLGEWGFRRLTLKVDPRVLVPRPETEIVVERCLARIANLDNPRVLDVGTGSGGAHFITPCGRGDHARSGFRRQLRHRSCWSDLDPC